MMHMEIQCQDQATSSIKVSRTIDRDFTHVLNTSIECLCVVREKLDQASNLIDIFKTSTKKIFEFPYSCVHTNMDTQKFI